MLQQTTYWIACVFISLFGLTTSVFAQDESKLTPTRILPLNQGDLTRMEGNVQRPNGIFWFDNHLYTACTGDSTVYEIHAITGVTRTYIFGVQNAHSLYVERETNGQLALWVPDYNRNELLYVTRAGVKPVVGEFAGPWGMAYLDEAHFLISNLLSGSLERVSRSGDRSVILRGLASPAGVVRTEDHVFVANNGSSRRAIEWYAGIDLTEDGIDLAEGERGILVSGVTNVAGLQLDASGEYLYFTYALGTRGMVARVRIADCLDSGCETDAIETVIFTDLSAPLAGLTLSPDNRLYVHTMYSPDLYWVSLDEVVGSES